MLSFIIYAGKSTVIVGGLIDLQPDYDTSAVRYYGPCKIEIPRISETMYSNGVVYINGTLYSCGGRDEYRPRACYKYNLSAHSDSWEYFTTIPGKTSFGSAVAFNDFFWYFNDEIQQVSVNDGSVKSFSWNHTSVACAVGNGSHSVVITNLNSSVLMYGNSSSPLSWRTVVELDTAVRECGCLWFGNTIYVTGGVDSSNNRLRTTQLINTNTFQLTQGPLLSRAVSSHGMGVIHGEPAVIGGIEGKGNEILTKDIYVHDSRRKYWYNRRPSLPYPLGKINPVTF